MTDLAELGLRFTSHGGDKAVQTLDSVATNAKRAETATGLLAVAEDRAEHAMDELTGAAKRSTSAISAMNAVSHQQTAILARNRMAMGLTASEGLNLSRQLSDVGVSAAMGINPLMIMVQQGPQIADVFQQASNRGVGFSAALRSITASAAPLLAGVAAVGAVVGIIGGGFAIATKEINDSNKDLTRGLGLTEKQLEDVENRTVTMGDTLAATFAVLGQRLTTPLEAELEATKGFFADWYDGVVDGGDTAIGSIVGAFVGALRAIQNGWRELPSIMGDVAISAAQAVIDAVESMVNGSIALITGLIDQANKLPLVNIAPMGGVEFGRLPNPFAGAAMDDGSSMMMDFIMGRRAGIEYWKDFTGDVTSNAQGRARERILEQAGDASGRGGRSPEEQEYERLIRNSERFLESLQMETRELGLNAKERRLLAIETAALNAPTRELTQSILEAGTAWEMSMLLLEERDRQAKASDYVKYLTEEAEFIALETEMIGASNVERAVAIAQLETELRLRRELGDHFADSPQGKGIIAQAGEVAAADVRKNQKETATGLEEQYMLDLWTQIDDQAASAGRGMVDALGQIGEAFDGILSSMTNYQRGLESIRLEEEKYLKSVGENIDPRRIEMFAQQRTMAEVESYASMTVAAKSFFKEGSDGWRALQAIEMGFRAYQFAMAIQSMVLQKQETATSVLSSTTRATGFMAEGAAKMFAALGPLGFPAVAAMVAVLASFGLRGKGGGGGSYSAAADPQASVQSSVQTAQASVRRDQATRDGFVERLAASVRVQVEFDDPMFRARVREETVPMVAEGSRQAFQASRRAVPADLAKKQSVTLGKRG